MKEEACMRAMVDTLSRGNAQELDRILVAGPFEAIIRHSKRSLIMPHIGAKGGVKSRFWETLLGRSSFFLCSGELLTLHAAL